MRTQQLIDALAADAATPPARLRPAFALALAVAVAAAAVVFQARLGVRADVMSALGTVRFPFKFVVTVLLGAGAGSLLLALARPGARLGGRKALMALAPMLLLAAVAIELWVLPENLWGPRAVGSMATACLTNIPLISAVPLAVLLIALRRGAPESPALAGGVAGLLAGAIGATFYASNCPDDSPLFVVVWYTIAIGMVSLAGAAIGSRLLRW